MNSGWELYDEKTIQDKYQQHKAIQEKYQQHKSICDEIHQLYCRKNQDYGDSFGQSYREEGMAMVRIRLGDKFNRLKTLTRNPDSQQVQDESIRDTLIDLANYAIMTIVEMENENDRK